MQINLHMEIRVTLGTVLFNHDVLFFLIRQEFKDGNEGFLQTQEQTKHFKSRELPQQAVAATAKLFIRTFLLETKVSCTAANLHPKPQAKLEDHSF